MSSRVVVAFALAAAAFPAAPASANLGDGYDQAKARVRARGDVAMAEFWLAKATGKVVRERWRARDERGWTYAEARAICRAVLGGREPISSLHLGLGWRNGGALYYDAKPELDDEGEPRYAGRTRVDLEYVEPMRVSALNIQGPDYDGSPESDDAYEEVRHLVAEDEDQR